MLLYSGAVVCDSDCISFSLSYLFLCSFVRVQWLVIQTAFPSPCLAAAVNEHMSMANELAALLLLLANRCGDRLKGMVNDANVEELLSRCDRYQSVIRRLPMTVTKLRHLRF